LNLKEKIMQNAARLFAKKGFFKTTVDEIAALSGISKGAVYLYFKDKESIYIEVIDSFFTQGLKHLKEVKKLNISSSEKLEKIFTEWNIFLEKSKFCLPIASIENINLSQKIFKKMKERIMSRIMEIFKEIEDIIDEGIKNKEFENVNKKFATFLFMEIVRMPAIVSMVFKKEKLENKEIIETFLNGLRRR